VIIGDPDVDKDEPLLRAYGRMIESLNGRYVTACDVGTYPADMEVIARETRWATGLPASHGGAGDSGILTSLGVFVSMQACAKANSASLVPLTGRILCVGSSVFAFRWKREVAQFAMQERNSSIPFVAA